MTSRICARLIILLGIAGLAQVRAHAQATLDGASPQFGTEPAPYATPAVPETAPRGVPVAEPATGISNAYVPGGAPGAPGAYAPAGAPLSVAPETGALGAPDPTKPLGRGDVVTFSIIQDREAPQTMRVTDTGELDFSAFPKIGRISVAGRNCAQVAADLKRRLEADYYYHADVTLGINQVNHLDSRGKVYLSGNVRAPGPQDLPYNEHTMVSTAIIRAGGFDKYANESKVQITRRDKDGKTVKFYVNVKAVIEGGHLDKDVEVQDGDYIYVPQNFINI
jgi:protein involved in polysaccharide export with SLBB domain